MKDWVANWQHTSYRLTKFSFLSFEFKGILFNSSVEGLVRAHFRGVALTAKTVDKDPAGPKRWISRKEV